MPLDEAATEHAQHLIHVGCHAATFHRIADHSFAWIGDRGEEPSLLFDQLRKNRHICTHTVPIHGLADRLQFGIQTLPDFLVETLGFGKHRRNSDSFAGVQKRKVKLPGLRIQCQRTNGDELLRLGMRAEADRGKIVSSFHGNGVGINQKSSRLKEHNMVFKPVMFSSKRESP